MKAEPEPRKARFLRQQKAAQNIRVIHKDDLMDFREVQRW